MACWSTMVRTSSWTHSTTGPPAPITTVPTPLLPPSPSRLNTHLLLHHAAACRPPGPLGPQHSRAFLKYTLRACRRPVPSPSRQLLPFRHPNGIASRRGAQVSSTPPRAVSHSSSLSYSSGLNTGCIASCRFRGYRQHFAWRFGVQKPERRAGLVNHPHGGNHRSLGQRPQRSNGTRRPALRRAQRR